MKVTNILAILILACLSFTSCQKDSALLSNQQQTGDNAAVETTQDDLALRQCRQKYSNEVVIEWIQLQQKLIKTTPGFNFGPAPSGRILSYIGIAMYEALIADLSNDYQSLSQQVGGIPSLPTYKRHLSYYAPASVNAAMAQCTRDFFVTTTPENKAAIEALEAAFNAKFKSNINAAGLQRSNEFGKQVATAIFEWSKTDGTFAVNPTYVPPVGPGLWVPTPPAFLPAINPYGGNNRVIMKNFKNRVPIPPPPFAYSEDPNSDFYKMVNEVYTISQNLTPDEINIVKTWSDSPVNYNLAAHNNNILTQMVVKHNVSLDEAAVLYAKYGVAVIDLTYLIFKSKYQYNQLRPITYIRSVMGQSTWNTVIPTHPHPEYLWGHAVVSQTLAEILKDKFGSRTRFTDYTHEALYGTRSYASFDAYAKEAAWSGVLSGLHYKNTADISLKLGVQVGRIANRLRFKKEVYH